MKYFKIFETEQDYTEYLVSSDFIAPNVSVLRDCSNTWINAERPEPEEKDYFAFIARENATFSFTNPIEYSLDSGLTWVILAANTQSPSIASGEKIMWKKTVAASGTPNGVGTFSATGDFDAEGNAMSLIYGDDFIWENGLENYPHALQYLFRYNNHIINAEHMELSALFLSPSCYDNMFFKCYNLETAPELPASNLTPYCYRSMFEECTSLKAMPSMGMVAVDEGSCQYMFYSATSLTTVIEKLEPLSLAEQCYDSMFELCTSLTQAPELPATELVSQCYNHMFNACSSLKFIKAAFVTEPNSDYTHEWVDGVAATGQFFKGIDSKWNVVGVNGVPSGWTVLSFETVYFSFTCKDENGGEFSFTAATPGDTLYYSRNFGEELSWTEYTEPISVSYNDNIVFKGELTANGTNGIGTFGSNCFFNVYGNVMSLIYGGDFKNQTTLKADYNFAHLLEGCTHLIEAFELVLPSTTLRPHCYDSMFKGCWSMVNTPELNAMTLAEGCYAYMFYDCETIDEACELPATTLAANCYSHMFEDCEELYKRINLPAETLVSGCYDYMFKGTGVNYVNAMFTTEPGTNYTNNWLADVSEYGTFIVNSSASWALNYDNYRGESGIPAYTAETEPGVTAYTWNVVGSDYKTKWVSEGEACSGNTTLRYELFEEQYSEDGGITWNSFEPKVYSAKTIAEESIHCGFLSGDTDDVYDSSYIDEGGLINADLTFVNEDGKPNIKTDADGYVTEFTYTDATDDSPVTFNGNTTVDTVYHAFKTSGARNFEIIMKAYCDGNDQVYRSGDDDNMVNLLTVRGESGGSVTYADGFSFRISRNNPNHLILNGNNNGQGFNNPYIVDDGSHLWYFKIRYINGFLSIYDMKNNRYVPTTSPWGTGGKQCDFNLDDGCSAVLACAVKSDESYYRYCKCKFFEFSLKTLFPQERDRVADINVEYICDNGDKYYKVYHEISYDGGETWTIMEIRKGNLYERDSEDCKIDYEEMYFTIESLEDNNTVKWLIGDGSQTPNNFALDYSTDGGINWSTIPSGQTRGSVVNLGTINSGDTMLLRSTANTWGVSYSAHSSVNCSENYVVYGNIMSLLYGEDFKGKKDLSEKGSFALSGLFWANQTQTGKDTGTATTNTTLISAENLVLPATTLNSECYNGMFRGCVNLTTAPKELPALNLVLGVYSSMFDECYNLETAPIISATTQQSGTMQHCRRMFRIQNTNVSPKLTTAPVLRIKKLGTKTYEEMFKGQKNLNHIVCLATDISGTSCTTNWVQNVQTNSGTFVKDTNTNWGNCGVSKIPCGWTVENYVEE